MKNKFREYGKIKMALSRGIAKSARALHLTAPTIASFEVAIDNELIMRSKSNSWVRNHINACASVGLALYPMDGGTVVFGDGYLNFRSLTGVIYDGALQSYGYRVDSTSNFNAGSNYGILLGSSDAAESFDQFALSSIITHGNAAGQLYRNAQTLLSKAWDSIARKWVMQIQRTFTNNSGNAITVKELGYYTTGGATSAGHPIMLLRDVLPSPVEIAAGQTATITYTFEYYF
jgi:hypothetical protein